MQANRLQIRKFPKFPKSPKLGVDFLLGALLLLVVFSLVEKYPAGGFRIYPYSTEGISLSQIKFVSGNWPHIWWNSFWFLGYPTKFSGTPLFSLGLGLVSHLLPSIEIVLLYRWAIAVFACLIPVAFYALLKSLRFSRKTGVISSLWFLLTPSILYLVPNVFNQASKIGLPSFLFFSALFLGQGPKVVALFWALLAMKFYADFSRCERKKTFFLALIFSSLAMFTNSAVGVLIFVGITGLVLSMALTDKLRLSHYLTLYIFTLLCGLLIVSLWYGPSYWLHALSGASLAGKQLSSVLRFMFSLLLILLPSSLGFAVVRLRGISVDRKFSFILFFLSSFIFLTLARLVADIDFWQDYTAYGIEIDLGVALAMGLLFDRLLTYLDGGIKNAKFKVQSFNLKSKIRSLGRLFNYLTCPLQVTTARFLVVALLAVCGSLLFIWRYMSNMAYLSYATYYSDSFEYQISRFLAGNVKPNERVFVSGNMVFWLNYFASDVMQVRGGDEPAAIHLYWADGAYQIREGGDAELADLWLRALGASWVVVHDENSADAYHDFKEPAKFVEMPNWQIVYEQDGDAVYHLKEGGDSRIISAIDEGAVALLPPKDGEDAEPLRRYLNSRQEIPGCELAFESQQELVLGNCRTDSSKLGLPVAYTRGWQVTTENDSNQPCLLGQDVLGNMTFDADKCLVSDGSLVLEYKENRVVLATNLALFISGCLLALNYPRSFMCFKDKILKRLVHYFHFGVTERDEQVDY